VPVAVMSLSKRCPTKGFWEWLVGKTRAPFGFGKLRIKPIRNLRPITKKKRVSYKSCTMRKSSATEIALKAMASSSVLAHIAGRTHTEQVKKKLKSQGYRSLICLLLSKLSKKKLI
jgi:hypothetical protein